MNRTYLTHRVMYFLLVASSHLLPTSAFCQDAVDAKKEVIKESSLRRFEALVFPSKDLELSAPIAGILRELPIKEGSWVKKGDVLATFHSELDRITAERTESALEKALFDWKAHQRLEKEEAVSREAYLVAELAYQVAQLDCRAAVAVIDEKTIRAPWDGQIINVTRDIGETLTTQDKFIRLIDFKTVEIRVYLPDFYHSKFQKGDDLPVIIPLLDAAEVKGKIVFIDPIIDAASSLFRVTLEIENPDLSIKPGMCVEVVVPVAEGHGDDEKQSTSN